MPPRGYRKEKPTFRCEQCAYTSQRLSCFNDHLRIHSGEKPFKCAICGKGFTQKSNLGQHLKVHGAGAPHLFRCQQKGCDFTSKWKSSLLIHERWHEGERPYQCTLCEKTFTQSTHCRTHMRESHGNERRFKCEECPKSFKRSDHLTRHMAYHKAEKTCECTVCGKGFVDEGGLRSHYRTHQGDAGKRYRCDRCPYRSFFKQCLDVHYRIHLGVKPYNCAHCGKTFRTSSSVKIHIRMVHQGEEGKIFRCLLCDFSTANNQSLKNHHRRIHLGYKERASLKCLACGKLYTTRASYYTHRRKVHPQLPRIDAIYRRDRKQQQRDSDKCTPLTPGGGGGDGKLTSATRSAGQGAKTNTKRVKVPASTIPNITNADVVYLKTKGDKVENLTVRIPSETKTRRRNSKKREEKEEEKSKGTVPVLDSKTDHSTEEEATSKNIAPKNQKIYIPKKSPKAKPIKSATDSPKARDKRAPKTPKIVHDSKAKKQPVKDKAEEEHETSTEEEKEERNALKIVLKSPKGKFEKKQKEKSQKEDKKKHKKRTTAKRGKSKRKGEEIEETPEESEPPVKVMKRRKRREQREAEVKEPRPEVRELGPEVPVQVSSDTESQDTSSTDVSPGAISLTIAKPNRRKSTTPKKSTGPRFSPVAVVPPEIIQPEAETTPPTTDAPISTTNDDAAPFTSAETSLVQIAPVLSMKAYITAGGRPIHFKFVPVLAQSSDSDDQDPNLTTSEVCAAIQKGTLDFASMVKDGLVSSGVRVSSTSCAEMALAENLPLPPQPVQVTPAADDFGLQPLPSEGGESSSDYILQETPVEENNNELLPLEPLDLSISSRKKFSQEAEEEQEYDPEDVLNITPIEYPDGIRSAEVEEGWVVPERDTRRRGRPPKPMLEKVISVADPSRVVSSVVINVNLEDEALHP